MIQQIEALNYRSLRYVSQARSPFQILVGPNASGKSTFLDVVALLSDFVQDGLTGALLFNLENGRGRASRLDELIFNHCSDHLELAIELAVPDGLRSSHQHGDWQPDTARYEVAFGFEQRGELEIRSETLWLIDSQGNQPQPRLQKNQPDFFPTEVQPPSTLLTETQPPPGWQAVVKKQPGGRDYFQAETSSWNMAFRVGPQKAALAGVPEDQDRFPITIWVRDFLRSSIRLLALNLCRPFIVGKCSSLRIRHCFWAWLNHNNCFVLRKILQPVRTRFALYS